MRQRIMAVFQEITPEMLFDVQRFVNRRCVFVKMEDTSRN